MGCPRGGCVCVCECVCGVYVYVWCVCVVCMCVCVWVHVCVSVSGSVCRFFYDISPWRPIYHDIPYSTGSDPIRSDPILPHFTLSYPILTYSAKLSVYPCTHLSIPTLSHAHNLQADCGNVSGARALFRKAEKQSSKSAHTLQAWATLEKRAGRLRNNTVLYHAMPCRAVLPSQEECY